MVVLHFVFKSLNVGLYQNGIKSFLFRLVVAGHRGRIISRDLDRNIFKMAVD